MNELSITEYKGIRVLTTQQVAEAYGTNRKVISYNFNYNKDRYKVGKHYIPLKEDGLRAFREAHGLPSNLNKLYLWTEKGCFLHAKSLGTDKAWEVYEFLVDSYFNREKQLTDREIMRIQLGMIDDHEERIKNLENNMTIDCGQQRVLGDAVNHSVMGALGGKGSGAYKAIGKKVFAECNRDLKNFFRVNARNNVPKKRFDEAVDYAKAWKPCTNTVLLIREHNSQMALGDM